MRIKASNRLALLAAAGVALSTLSVAHLGATPTYASPSRSTADLSASDFHEVAAQGFGDPQNSWSWGSAYYKGNLYIGTNKAWACMQAAILNHEIPFLYPYPPPPDPDQTVQCTQDPRALPENGEIWQLNMSSPQPYTQSDWTEVYSSPPTVTISDPLATGGFTQTSRDMAFRNMLVYNDVNGDQAMYVSGLNTKPLNDNNVPPPSLLRTTDGTNFQAVPADTGTVMGSINTLPGIVGLLGSHGGCCLRGALAFNGAFYVSIGTVQGGGAVFMSPDPRLGNNSFQQVTPPGMQVFEFQSFNGHLYFGVQSANNGYAVYELTSSCVIKCTMADFTLVIPSGGGLGSAGNFAVTSMYVYTDTTGTPYLYVGSDGALNKTPTDIDRIHADNTWDLVVGTTRTISGTTYAPLSGLKSGFGWPFNWHMWRMTNYQGVLYVSTFDGSSLYKDTPIEPKLKPFMGFDLWASTDGVHFAPVTINGFGDMFSFGGRALVPTPQGLFVGSANWWQGLRIWLGSVPSKSWALAPSDVHIAKGSFGRVGLSWTPSSKATLYHVYRSTMAWTKLPQPSVPLYGDPETGLYSRKTTTLGAAMIPGPYVEVGTTTSSHFVDRSSWWRGHYMYYVVGQDASGNLSAASNATTYPNIAP